MDELEKFSNEAFNAFIEGVNHVAEETEKILQNLGEQVQTIAEEFLREGEHQCNELNNWWNESLNHQTSYSNQPRVELRRRLFTLVHGNENLADRLLDSVRRKYPNQSEDWYWEKVIYDLERDHT